MEYFVRETRNDDIEELNNGYKEIVKVPNIIKIIPIIAILERDSPIKSMPQIGIKKTAVPLAKG